MKTEGQFYREIKKNSEKYFSSFPLATRVCDEEYIYDTMKESMEFVKKQMTEKVRSKKF